MTDFIKISICVPLAIALIIYLAFTSDYSGMSIKDFAHIAWMNRSKYNNDAPDIQLSAKDKELVNSPMYLCMGPWCDSVVKVPNPLSHCYYATAKYFVAGVLMPNENEIICTWNKNITRIE